MKSNLGSRLRGALGRAGCCLGFGQNSRNKQQLLFSLYVQHQEEVNDSMSSRRLTRTSRRILLTTSIWTVIIIVVVFFVTYTILLVSVDHPFHSAIDIQPGRHRMRLMGKGFGLKNGTKDGLPVRFLSGEIQRTALWDPRLYDDPNLESPRCQSGNIFIIIITSTPDHFEHRAEIRRTWCNASLRADPHESGNWQCFYLVGQTDDMGVRLKVSLEQQRHGDILHGSYVDSYRNLTHKVMHGLAWVSEHCVAPYVLKTDDDCFVNTLLLRHFLSHHNKQTTGLYTGNIVSDMSKLKVIRNMGEKWAVSLEDYLPEYYPRFASGSGYVLSFDVVKRLVSESVFIKPIANEDAYVGIVMHHIGVEATLSGRFSLSSSGLRPCNFLYIVLTHSVTPTEQQDMFTKMVTARTRCSNQQEVLSWY